MVTVKISQATTITWLNTKYKPDFPGGHSLTGIPLFTLKNRGVSALLP